MTTASAVKHFNVGAGGISPVDEDEEQGHEEYEQEDVEEEVAPVPICYGQEGHEAQQEGE